MDDEVIAKNERSSTICARIFLPERHTPRGNRPDASDHAGAEIFLDAVNRRRRRRAHKARFELLAMGVIVDPFTRRRDPLAGRDDGRVTDDRDQIAMATGLRPQYTKPVIAVMEGDALDKASQDFPGRCFGLMPRRSGRVRYSHPCSLNAVRSTPGGAYHPAEP